LASHSAARDAVKNDFTCDQFISFFGYAMPMPPARKAAPSWLMHQKMKGVNSWRRLNSFGLKPSSFHHRGVLLGWYVTFATFLMTKQNYKSFFDFSKISKNIFWPAYCLVLCLRQSDGA
jgi:hypothetical protein